MFTLTPEQWQEVNPYLDEVLEILPEQRAAWLLSLSQKDARLASILQTLLDEQQQLVREGFLERSPLHVGSGLAGQQVGAYTLVSQIGQGGMGRVWLAHRSDGRFERQAAVKFISLALAGHATAERFNREGSILGRLTHPHIAELLDAGISADGSPYLILEYVDGVAIDHYCDEHKLDVDARIKLFLDVLGAVAGAHAHLIVHRDIKPSNVLVRNDGQVKLLDFGIAKLLAGEGETDSATMLTMESGAALTPRFAAPEQVTGGIVTTATDVYALGVLLYLLLTGQHPAGARVHSTADLVKAITEADAPRASGIVSAASSAAEKRNTTPEKLRRQLSGDLETILGKSLKKAPQERYASVTAFADDLRRYLRHEPIAVRPDTLRYRVAKFVRRNRTSVLLTAAALLLVIASLSTGLYIANRERRIAEGRFLQVRQLANKFIEFDDAIRGLPGATMVRSQMVGDSLQYLNALGDEVHGDNDLANDIAYAYVRVAHAQGDPTSANLGQFDDAELSLGKAQRFVDPVLASDPMNRRGLFIAATIAHDRMELANSQERWEEAFSWADKTADLVERFLRLKVEFTQHEIYSMGYFEQNVANAYANARHFDKAVQAAERAMVIVRPFPSRQVEGSATSILVRAHWQAGDLDGALNDAKRVVDLQQAQAQNGHASLRINLANALCAEGLILGQADAEPSLGRSREALALIQRGIDIGEELAGKDSSDYLSRFTVANLSIPFGNILRHEAPGKALAVYDHALARLREAKSSVNSRLAEADLLAASSYPARWIGRREDARQRIKDAFQLLRDARLYPDDKIEPLSEVDDALQAQADDYAETGQTVEAIAAYQDLLAKLMAWKPDLRNDLRDATRIARVWTGLAILLRRAGRLDEAAQLEKQRAELFDHWKATLPNGDFLIRQSLLQFSRRPSATGKKQPTQTGTSRFTFAPAKRRA